MSWERSKKRLAHRSARQRWAAITLVKSITTVSEIAVNSQRVSGEYPAVLLTDRQRDCVDAEQPDELRDGDPSREVVAGDQRRPDEDRTVLADGDAALIDQQPGRRRGRGEDQVGGGERDPAEEEEAEQAGGGHRCRGRDQRRGIAAARVGQHQPEPHQRRAAEQQRPGSTGLRVAGGPEGNLSFRQRVHPVRRRGRARGL